MSEFDAVAIVTGVTGQDGSLLCDYLLLTEPDLLVVGVSRHSSNPNHVNCEHLKSHRRFRLVNADLSDQTSIDLLVTQWMPKYFINFAANSSIRASSLTPNQVYDVNMFGVVRCLDAIRKVQPECRFFNAGSSEEFGTVHHDRQDQSYPLNPRNLYGASKAGARHVVETYRNRYGIYAVQAFLYNHESTRRGKDFVSRKITDGVARRTEVPIRLGNLTARRDWSDARDIVRGIWLMMQQDAPRDYLLSSGTSHTVMEFVEQAFEVAGVSGRWEGDVDVPLSLKFVAEGSVLVESVQEFFRPNEEHNLVGDSTETREVLGWEPVHSFRDMIRDMVVSDGVAAHTLPSVG